MSAAHLFSESDRKRIADAVKEAESRTSGEIVPVIVARSATYASSLWKAAMIGVLPGLILHEWVAVAGSGWGPDPWLAQLMPLTMLLGALLFAGLARWIPAFHRMLVPEAEMIEAVHARAQQAFLENEVFDTRERTGILLLVSLFEHRVEVLGDSGINSKVQEDDWGDVVTDIIGGVKEGDPTGGLVKAIHHCGDLLEEAGVERRDDDENELGNAPRIH